MQFATTTTTNTTTATALDLFASPVSNDSWFDMDEADRLSEASEASEPVVSDDWRKLYIIYEQDEEEEEVASLPVSSCAEIKPVSGFTMNPNASEFAPRAHCDAMTPKSLLLLNPLALPFHPSGMAAVMKERKPLNPRAVAFIPKSPLYNPKSNLNPLAAPFNPHPISSTDACSLNPLATPFIPKSLLCNENYIPKSNEKLTSVSVHEPDAACSALSLTSVNGNVAYAHERVSESALNPMARPFAPQGLLDNLPCTIDGLPLELPERPTTPTTLIRSDSTPYISPSNSSHSLSSENATDPLLTPNTSSELLLPDMHSDCTDEPILSEHAIQSNVASVAVEKTELIEPPQQSNLFHRARLLAIIRGEDVVDTRVTAEDVTRVMMHTPTTGFVMQTNSESVASYTRDEHKRRLLAVLNGDGACVVNGHEDRFEAVLKESQEQKRTRHQQRLLAILRGDAEVGRKKDT